MKKFNQHKYLDDQIWEAFLCPVNRHCTRVEHNCDDWALFQNPGWLLEHFVRCGGAEEFSKRRENKEYWIEEEEKYELSQSTPSAPEEPRGEDKQKELL